MGPYIYLVGFVWQRTARRRLLNPASSTAVNQIVGVWADTQLPTASLPSKAATPPPPPSQRVFVLNSDLWSSVSGWCGDIPTELPQNSCRNVNCTRTPGNFTLSFCHPHAPIVSSSLRPPPVAHLVQSVPLWDEYVANFHLKRRRSTAARLSTRPPRLDFLLQQQHYHPPRRRQFLASQPALAPTRLSVTSEKRQGPRTTAD
jgi:hypothetical protein